MGELADLPDLADELLDFGSCAPGGLKVCLETPDITAFVAVSYAFFNAAKAYEPNLFWRPSFNPFCIFSTYFVTFLGSVPTLFTA